MAGTAQRSSHACRWLAARHCAAHLPPCPLQAAAERKAAKAARRKAQKRRKAAAAARQLAEESSIEGVGEEEEEADVSDDEAEEPWPGGWLGGWRVALPSVGLDGGGVDACAWSVGAAAALRGERPLHPPRRLLPSLLPSHILRSPTGFPACRRLPAGSTYQLIKGKSSQRFKRIVLQDSCLVDHMVSACECHLPSWCQPACVCLAVGGMNGWDPTGGGGGGAAGSATCVVPACECRRPAAAAQQQGAGRRARWQLSRLQRLTGTALQRLMCIAPVPSPLTCRCSCGAEAAGSARHGVLQRRCPGRGQPRAGGAGELKQAGQRPWGAGTAGSRRGVARRAGGRGGRPALHGGWSAMQLRSVPLQHFKSFILVFKTFE